MFVSQLTNIHVLCSSVADIFIDFDTKDYSAVTFLKYIKTEEDTLFLRGFREFLNLQESMGSAEVT
jgi:hypothetical protein